MRGIEVGKLENGGRGTRRKKMRNRKFDGRKREERLQTQEAGNGGGYGRLVHGASVRTPSHNEETEGRKAVDERNN